MDVVDRLDKLEELVTRQDEILDGVRQLHHTDLQHLKGEIESMRMHLARLDAVIRRVDGLQVTLNSESKRLAELAARVTQLDT